MLSFHSFVASIGMIFLENLVKIIESVENKTPVRHPNLKTLTKSLTSAGAHIRGSPCCKQGYQRESYGLMIKFGTPPLWMTLSPEAVLSPIFLRLAGHEIDLSKITISDIPLCVERAKIVANDPVVTAKFFNLVIGLFISSILEFKQLARGIFGQTSAYYGCIEEQDTGTLHIYMIVQVMGFKAVFNLKSELKD